MRICVIGAGPAGLMAAGFAARTGAEVTLLERNEKAGKKLYITGKGRCNVTNLCDAADFFSNVVTNPKFLFSAYRAFDCRAAMAFFEEQGCPLKVERGGRVFPQSDKSSDIIRALTSFAGGAGVRFEFNSYAKDIVISKDGMVTEVVTDRKTYPCDAAIIACGGLSYPATGSTGDGYALAKKAGHTLTETVPALVPLKSRDPLIDGLSGLTLKNVGVTVLLGGKEIRREFGELLFTHSGVSGPTILTLSSYIGRLDLSKAELSIDLKPALDAQTLDARLLRDFGKNLNRQLKNSLDELLPRSLIPKVIARAGLDAEKPIHSVTAPERARLSAALKDFRITLSGLGGYSEAVVTSGGVEVRAVDPKTMRSKIVPNLYLCGEVLDIDALTGGFNIQTALSTGRAAGIYAATL